MGGSGRKRVSEGERGGRRRVGVGGWVEVEDIEGLTGSWMNQNEI